MFRNQNPSSENLARILYKLLGKKLNTEEVRVSKIRVSETPDTAVFYWEE
jgi:6-pyruvoyltetrahydropterin/6-carboxytetrahydropterin synthase